MCKIRFSAPLAIFRGAHLFAICIRLYDYLTKSCRQQAEVMKMKKFATLDKAKPDTENIRGLNLAAVMCTTVHVSRLSL
jgi:hypothetical protein